MVGKKHYVGQGFLDKVISFSSNLELQIGNNKNGFSGQIKNLSEQLNGQLSPTLNNITDNNLKVAANLKPDIAKLLETNDVAKAAELLNGESSLGLTEIEDRLLNIPVTVAEKVARNNTLPSKSNTSRLIGG